jgi:hypothetical protein
VNPFYILKVFPPNESLSIQVESGYSGLQVFQEVMDSEILLLSKQLGLRFLSSLYLTIKRGWFGLLEFFEIMTFGMLSLLLFSSGI